MGRVEMVCWDEREIVLTWRLAAARSAVFGALTTPAAIGIWLRGPPDWSMLACDIDLRVGGAYHYLLRRAADGAEARIRGTYREIVADELLAHGGRFDAPEASGEVLATMVLTTEGDCTVLRATVLCESRAVRDRVLASPVEQSLAAGCDRLETLVCRAAKRPAA